MTIVYIIISVFGASIICVFVYKFTKGQEARKEVKRMNQLISRRAKASKEKRNANIKKNESIENVNNNDNIKQSYADKLQDKPTRKTRK